MIYRFGHAERDTNRIKTTGKAIIEIYVVNKIYSYSEGVSLQISFAFQHEYCSLHCTIKINELICSVMQ